MEITFLNPVHKDMIWGSEDWAICNHKNGSNIENFNENRTMYGTKCEKLDRFPILNKFINAKDRLSIQVHPGDEYALKNDGDSGKTEMWYIVDAKPGAQIVYGTKEGTEKEDLLSNVEEKLNYVNVEKGDIIFIPSGTIHAVLDGITIFEIQQNSDTTYRVFDWNRVDKDGKGRELHINKALDVVNFDFKPEIIKTNNDAGEKIMVENQYFNMAKVNVKNKYQSKAQLDTFITYTVIEGEGVLHTEKESHNLTRNQTFIIPASIAEFYIEAKNMELIKTYL